MEFSLSPPMVWLILLVVMLLIEAFTLGLTTVWFAGGSLAGFFCSLADFGVYAQIIIALIVSFVLILLFRPLAKKRFNRGRVRTNAQTLIGETGVVVEPIDNVKAQGSVVVHGQEWTARAIAENNRIETNTPVEILDIRGVKLMVKKKETE